MSAICCNICGYYGVYYNDIAEHECNVRLENKLYISSEELKYESRPGDASRLCLLSCIIKASTILSSCTNHSVVSPKSNSSGQPMPVYMTSTRNPPHSCDKKKWPPLLVCSSLVFDPRDKHMPQKPTPAHTRKYQAKDLSYRWCYGKFALLGLIFTLFISDTH